MEPPRSGALTHYKAGSAVEYFGFASRKTTRLYTLDRPFWFGFALAPNERSLLFSKTDSRTSDLMVVENLP